MGLSAAAEWTHAEQRLTRGSQAGINVNAASSNDLVVPVSDDSNLVVEVDMTATAGADLAVTVTPYEADGVTPMGVTIAPVTSTGPTLLAGHSYFIGQYDVSGYDKVRIRVGNNNVGAQTITRESWRLT